MIYLSIFIYSTLGSGSNFKAFYDCAKQCFFFSFLLLVLPIDNFSNKIIKCILDFCMRIHDQVCERRQIVAISPFGVRLWGSPDFYIDQSQTLLVQGWATHMLQTRRSFQTGMYAIWRTVGESKRTDRHLDFSFCGPAFLSISFFLLKRLPSWFSEAVFVEFFLTQGQSSALRNKQTKTL